LSLKKLYLLCAQVALWYGDNCTCFSIDLSCVSLVPDLEAEIIPEASHVFTIERSEIVNARILQFCQMQAFRSREPR
jgi:hypothetical protein